MLLDNLPNNTVHLYYAQLSAAQVQADNLLPLLDAAERVKASRFIRPELQERYILTHGLLRLITANYLKISPQAVTFTFNQHKKPAIANANPSSLQFNLSHSEDAVVFAFANGISLGVDIEKIQADAKLEVAQRFFTAAETAALKSLTPAEQAPMFYRLWSKKEAVVKADGKGFAALHTAFSVKLSETPETVSLEQQQWSLYTLNVIPGYATALAASQPVNIRQQSCADILFHSQ